MLYYYFFPNGVKCQRTKNRRLKHMLEWLEVWLDVGFNKKLVHEYRIIIIIIIIIKSTTN